MSISFEIDEDLKLRPHPFLSSAPLASLSLSLFPLKRCFFKIHVDTSRRNSEISSVTHFRRIYLHTLPVRFSSTRRREEIDVSNVARINRVKLAGDLFIDEGAFALVRRSIEIDGRGYI